MTGKRHLVSCLITVGFSLAPVFGASGSLQKCPEPLQGLGLYFPKKAYVEAPLPNYQATKSQLPSPIDDEHPDWIEAYWHGWQLAFRNFHEPLPDSGFVSQFIDAAFSDKAYL